MRLFIFIALAISVASIDCTSQRTINMTLKNDLVTAIKKAASAIREKHPDDELHGFALCTDDGLMTLYLVSCTKTWFAERADKYESVGYISVEWSDSTGDDYLDEISKQMAKLANSDKSQEARDRRFTMLVAALQECRNENLFNEDTLLCCGSTDPSPHMEMLAMHAVDKLNTKFNADQFAKHLGYEQYRDNGG